MIEGTLRVLALLVAGMIGTLDRQLPPAQCRSGRAAGAGACRHRGGHRVAP
jgi:hypothetical protein